MTKVLQRITCNFEGSVRRSMLRGRQHVIVPTVMLVEGVLIGNNGPGFYPKEESLKVIPSWNNKPAVVYHPMRNGDYISAADPIVMETRQSGFILNTSQDGEKLRTETWLDEERTNEIDNRIIKKLDANEKVEVSTGLFSTREMTAGEHNGKKYEWIAREWQPDHLAILPDKKGACSIADGAGMLQVNEGGGTPERSQLVLRNSLNHAIARLNTKGVYTLENNEMSFSQVTLTISELLAAKFGEKGKYWGGYICEVFSDYVIFYDRGQLYMIGYKNENDSISLEGKAEKVTNVQKYVTSDGSYVGNENGKSLVFVPNQKKETTMAFDKRAHVTALIANGQLKESDRATFEALDDKVVESIAVVKKEVTPPPVPSPTQPVLSVAQLPQEMQDMLKESAEIKATEKAKMITNIMGAPGNIYTKEWLELQDNKLLRGIDALVEQNKKSQTGANPPMFNSNYAGAGGGVPLTGNTELPEYDQKPMKPILAGDVHKKILEKQQAAR